MNDLISRQDAIDALEWKWAGKAAIDAIKGLPSAQKKGKWIHHENPEGVFSLECPYCKCWFLHEHLVRNSYCPNCGAEMTEGEQNG